MSRISEGEEDPRESLGDSLRSLLSPRLSATLNSPGSSIGILDDNFVKDISASLVVKQQLSKRGVRFSDTIDEQDISRLHQSALEELFYCSEDFATFRYTAFMEDCGLDPDEFD